MGHWDLNVAPIPHCLLSDAELMAKGVRYSTLQYVNFLKEKNEER